jgi:hypothetical protein
MIIKVFGINKNIIKFEKYLVNKIYINKFYIFSLILRCWNIKVDKMSRNYKTSKKTII